MTTLSINAIFDNNKDVLCITWEDTQWTVTQKEYQDLSKGLNVLCHDGVFSYSFQNVTLSLKKEKETYYQDTPVSYTLSSDDGVEKGQMTLNDITHRLAPMLYLLNVTHDDVVTRETVECMRNAYGNVVWTNLLKEMADTLNIPREDISRDMTIHLEDSYTEILGDEHTELFSVAYGLNFILTRDDYKNFLELIAPSP